MRTMLGTVFVVMVMFPATSVCYLPGTPKLGYTPSCPSGWTAFPGGRYCYKYLSSVGKQSYSSASYSCRQSGANVVMPKTIKENNKVMEIMHAESLTDVHIGLSDHEVDYKWMWDDGTSLNGFSDFSPSEPNKFYGNENCVALQKKSEYAPRIYWNDVRCSFLTHVICQKVVPQYECPNGSFRLPSTSTCFFPAGNFTFDDGLDYCSQLGMELPKPKTGVLDELMVKVMQEYGISKTYIGLRQKSAGDGWRWQDNGEDISSYSNFDTGVSLSVLHCAVMAEVKNYLWSTQRCFLETPILCQCFLPIEGFTYTDEVICPTEIIIPLATQNVPTSMAITSQSTEFTSIGKTTSESSYDAEISTAPTSTLEGESESTTVSTLEDGSFSTAASTLESESESTAASTLEDGSFSTAAYTLESESESTASSTLESESESTAASTLESESESTTSSTLESGSLSIATYTLEGESESTTPFTTDSDSSRRSTSPVDTDNAPTPDLSTTSSKLLATSGTTSSELSDTSTSNVNTGDCVCACNVTTVYVYINSSEFITSDGTLLETEEERKAYLKSLSSSVRKRQCATDERTSARYVGVLGATLLAVPLIIIVSLDVIGIVCVRK